MDFKKRIIVSNIATMTVLDTIHTKGMDPSKDSNQLMQETRQKMLDAFVKTSSWKDVPYKNMNFFVVYLYLKSI